MENLPPEPHDVEPKATHAVLTEETGALQAAGFDHDPKRTHKSGTSSAVHRRACGYAGSGTSSAGATTEGWQAVGTALLYVLLFRASTWLPFTYTSTIFITLVAMVLVLVFTVRVARALQSSTALAINFLLAAVFALPLILFPILLAWFPMWGGWPQTGPVFGHYFGLIRHVMGLKELLLMWFAACIGVGIYRLVREMKLLLPMGVVLGLVDLMAVFSKVGVVHQAVSGQSTLAQTAMNALTIKMPSAHVTSGSAPIQLQIGFADFLFIALFFACFKRFGVVAWNTFVVLCATLSVYMLVVAYKDVALPALVPIGVVVIGMNLKQFRYERSEAFALLYAAILVAVISVLFWRFGHSPAPAPLPH